MILYPGNDNLIRLLNLSDTSGGDDATPAPITTALVQAQIKDAAGMTVGAPIILNYVAGTNGDYEGIAEDTLALVAGAMYTVEVTGTDGPGRTGFWTVRAQAQARIDV